LLWWLKEFSVAGLQIPALWSGRGSRKSSLAFLMLVLVLLFAACTTSLQPKQMAKHNCALPVDCCCGIGSFPLQLLTKTVCLAVKTTKNAKVCKRQLNPKNFSRRENLEIADWFIH